MKIAMMAPPWIPIPPRQYGGIEVVVSLLTEELVDLGHDVHLFAAPHSVTKAKFHPVLPKAHPDELNFALHETDHVATVFNMINEAGFEVLHDHTVSAVAYCDLINTPIVHTMHNGHAGDLRGYYARHAQGAHLVAVSQKQAATAPHDVKIAGVVPNPTDVEHWPFRERKRNYALWIGRVDDAKGPQRAIRAAQKAKMPLILAGPVQAGQESFFRYEIEPHLNDQIRYIGEVGGKRKANLFANAAALLMPIKWSEPFGLVMTEALSCGTPVIAFPEGAAEEIVIHGVNGYLVPGIVAMADALADLAAIRPADCRESVRSRYSPRIVARGYLDIYRSAAL